MFNLKLLAADMYPTSYHEISPKLPKILGDEKHIALPGYNLWLNFIKQVHIISSILDISKVEDAVSEALCSYPHVAGRLRKSHEGEWSISLTNSSVPLHIEQQAALRFDLGNLVIQDDLSPYINFQPKDETLVNGETPLLRLKLTFSQTQTALGVSWHHTLGDAAVLLRFMHTVSQLYRGLRPSYPLPSYQNSHFPTPSHEDIEAMSSFMPHFRKTYGLSELSAMYTQANTSIGRVEGRIKGYQVEALRATMRDIMPYLSTQDCITAYITTVLNRCLDVPISVVTNAASYRNISPLLTDPQAIGNAIYLIPSETISPSNSTNIFEIARGLRNSFEKCRTLPFIQKWMMVASYLMLNAANSNKSHFFGYPPGSMSVNSHLSHDWRSIHFGFPDTALFLTVGVSDRYLRFFRSNPSPKCEGELSVDPNAIDFCIGIHNDYREKIQQSLDMDLQSPFFPENAVTASV